ncbi:MAG: ketopantoate reductase family protein [Gemmataceae bacterium]
MDAITIVGAGGIGCALGYALAANGARVRFVEANDDKVAWGRRHGVRVDHGPPLPAEFIPFAAWRPDASDQLVLLCVKCYDNAEVLARLPARVPFLPVQNGFDACLDRPNRAGEGIASFVSECEPGRTHTHITRRGKLHIQAVASCQSVVQSLRAARLFRLAPVPDILPYKYAKLMYNAAISPIAAAAGVDNGRLLAHPLLRRLFFALLRENHAILRHAHVPLGTVGPFHPDTVAVILRNRWLAHSLAWAFYSSLRKTYCSMSGDLPRGQTEIDYYNRHLIDLAGAYPCPLNRWVYELVKRMERERLSPGLQWMEMWRDETCSIGI